MDESGLKREGAALAVAAGAGEQGGETAAVPRPTLSVVDACAIIVGIVVGVGIFRTPSIVAANVPNEAAFLLAWLLGGVVSLVGALCYAELATAYPHAGGDYHYFTRAFGRDIAFLFAWARLVVVQTGSIALLSFVFGDYATQLFPLAGPWSAALYAALAVSVLTTLNVIGVRQGKSTQNLLVSIKILGLTVVFIVGIVLGAPPPPPPAASSTPAFGLAMILVLLTYGGWNEAAYISAEVRDGHRNMARALLWSIGTITTIYLLINFTYLRGLGLATMSRSEVVAADLMRQTIGVGGAKFISALVAVAALGSTNATIFTGARTSYAVGRDFSLVQFLGRWHERANTPTNALLTQGVIALTLIMLGTWTRRGFETMVEYTAPVFWFFFLLTGLSLFVLRTVDPQTRRPFPVPLYPLTPLLFCAFSTFMLHSSLAYTGVGALAGVSALLAGVPVLLVARRRKIEAGR
jgi:basic amino acid/polyamine antiporter, APA family